MGGDIIRRLRNFFIKGMLHILGLGILLWVMGALMAVSTNQMSIIDFSLNPILFVYHWSIWLFKSWSALSFSAYNYMKLKLVLCLTVPPLIAIIYYKKNFSKIKDWDPIPAKEKVFGSASWATQADIKKAGLRSKEGMLLGVDSSGYYVADGYQHALLFAPTGAGKGVGFVLPNLLFWSHSVVVHDIKLENHMLTSGWRAKEGQEVFVWEPANPDGVSHCYNPIDWVSTKPGQMVDDVQKIGSLILPKQEFWENEARSLVVGILLFLIADPDKPNSFGEVVRQLRSDDVTYHLAVGLDTLGGVMHPVAYMNIAAFLQKADQERSGVVSTANSGLELWANPLIDAATASSDFNVLEFKKKKHSIFVGLTPDNIARLQKLMQVFYQQSTEFLSRKMPDLKEEPYGVMYLMDEFPTLGKMEQFKSGIAYFRGYRVRLFLIIQDTQQLKGTYEEAGMNSFLSNSTYRITFAANNYETANLISQLCGNKTVEQTSKSSPQFFDLNPATRTQNVSEVSRALLLPQEVIQLPRDEQIILIESQPPIRSKKIRYYADKFFTDRLLPPTFVPTQKPYDPKAKAELLPDEEDENAEDEVIENSDEMDVAADSVSSDQDYAEEVDDDFDDEDEFEEDIYEDDEEDGDLDQDLDDEDGDDFSDDEELEGESTNVENIDSDEDIEENQDLSEGNISQENKEDSLKELEGSDEEDDFDDEDEDIEENQDLSEGNMSQENQEDSLKEPEGSDEEDDFDDDFDDEDEDEDDFFDDEDEELEEESTNVENIDSDQDEKGELEEGDKVEHPKADLDDDSKEQNPTIEEPQKKSDKIDEEKPNDDTQESKDQEADK